MPTIRDDDDGFEAILRIAEQVLNQPRRHFDFNFSECLKIDHNGTVVLGGLASYVDYQNSLVSQTLAGIFATKIFSGAGVMFLVDSMRSIVRNSLINNNFLSHFTSEGYAGYPKGGYIGYREHLNLLDADNIAMHLNHDWLSNDKLNISRDLKEAILTRIFEIFMNAYGHGVSIQEISRLGVYSCGQYDKKEKKLNISVLDFGPGIVKNVLKSNTHIYDNVEAMKWALIRGNTTRTDSEGLDIPRGLGFDLLREFVAVNGGEMRVYSNDVQAVVLNGSFEVKKIKSNLRGTLVSIKINCDNRHYCFKSETQPQYF